MMTSKDFKRPQKNNTSKRKKSRGGDSCDLSHGSDLIEQTFYCPIDG